MAESPTWTRLVALQAEAALALFRRMNRPMASYRKGVTIGLAVALIAASVFSWWRLELGLADINWLALFLSAALVPASVLLTAFEYRLIASVNRVHVSLRSAVGVTVAGAVANLLPLPGAVMVRLHDLTARRGRASGAIRATAAAGGLWLGWSLTLAGLALLASDHVWLSGIFAVAGIALIAVSWILVRADARAYGSRWIARGSFIQIGSLAVGILRIWLTFAALGTEVTIVQAGVLVASGAIASTIGIVPGGLGIRELIAGVLAPLVGIATSAAILAVTVTRAVGLLMQAPVALSLTRPSGQSASSIERRLH